ncbi:MAG: hypothetical protein AAGG48_12350 [Planctomycetota bacterium]
MVVDLYRIAIIAGFLLAMMTSAHGQSDRSQSANDGLLLRGVSLPSVDPTPKPESTKTQQSQGCVLLKNDHVLFGRARQLGEQVIVRSGERGEIRLGRGQVACWADSPRDLYQYRVDHRRVSDVATHLKDARWCLRYDLLDLAASELRAVYALDPDNVEAQQLERQLSRRAANSESISNQDSSVSPVSFDEAPEPKDIIEHLDGAPLIRFARQIQPMLVNRCGNCHSQRAAETTAVEWRIFAPSAGTRASAEFTRTNLRATLPFIDQQNPGESRLLKYATTAHGGSDAQLGIRNAKAAAALDYWVQTTSTALSIADKNSIELESVEERPSVRSQDVPDGPKIELESREPVSNPNEPSRLPVVENPFDPEIFNRRFRMKTNGVKVSPESDTDRPIDP